MKARTALLVLIVALLGYLAFFNFSTLAQDVPMSLGFTEVHGPLGLVMLALYALMAAIFLAYVIAMQARRGRGWCARGGGPRRSG